MDWIIYSPLFVVLLGVAFGTAWLIDKLFPQPPSDDPELGFWD
jgi:hypothetical protein